MSQDIRWKQRFSNYNKALNKLDEAGIYIKSHSYSDKGFEKDRLEKGGDIIIEGLIQRFEYTHELAWNVMKDFLTDRGNNDIYGLKDATRKAVETGLISEGKVWMEMIISRNKTSHTYNEEIANEIFLNIIEWYHPAFLAFRNKMEEIDRGTHINFS